MHYIVAFWVATYTKNCRDDKLLKPPKSRVTQQIRAKGKKKMFLAACRIDLANGHHCVIYNVFFFVTFSNALCTVYNIVYVLL